MNKQTLKTKQQKVSGKALSKNAIKTLPVEKRLKELSGTVGDFIRYWGFRRIHGQIWSQVFLSSESLSGVQLTRRLGVSKALVSPALQELQDYGLIKALEDGKKTKRYQAVSDVVPVIQQILKNREAKLIEESKRQYEKLEKAHATDPLQKKFVDEQRLHELGEMIQVAQFAINFVLSQSNEESLRMWTDEATTA